MLEDFIRERRYLKNVSPKTVEWYGNSFHAFAGAMDTEQAVKERIIGLRERGIKAVSVNSWLRCLNAYFKWAGVKIHIERLKEEEKVIATLSKEQLERLIRFKPRCLNERRAHVISLVILDTGLRIGEVIGLKKDWVDFDNLVLRVEGKGRKERLVPMSFELRKVLYRWVQGQPYQNIFATRNGTRARQRNLLRDFKAVCRKLGITGVRCSFHTLRHTFAVSYLRAGGNQFYLMKILGHTDLQMTHRYVQTLNTDDLSSVHNRFSILNQMR